MIKIMISQPMAGKTTEQIKKERQKAIKQLNKYIHEEFTVIDTVIEDHEEKSDLQCFAESIMFLDKADCLVMVPGWESSRGCRLEHDIAKQYGKEVIHILRSEWEPPEEAPAFEHNWGASMWR